MTDAMHAAFDDASRIDVTPKMALLFNALSIAAVTLATLLPMGVVLHWLVIDLADIRSMVGLGPDLLPEFTLSQRIAAAAVVLLVTLPMAWGLIRLRSCLASFAAGRPFASTGIAGLRDFALAGVLAALAQFVGHTLLRLVLTWTAAPGHKQLAISIDSTTLMLAMFAGIIAALAWAMEKAAALAEENSQFI